MPRRRAKTSPIEDFVAVVALMPWWACIALALVSYLVLHGLAQPVAPISIDPRHLQQFVTRSFVTALASVGQFVVPIACLVAAGVSATQRRRRGALLASVTHAQAPDALAGMSWQEFELLVGEAFRLQGYEVSELGGAGPDGGVDLVLRKDKEKFLVQCKHWKAFKVGVQVVRELYGVMAAQGAAGGFVVTSGSFTEEAVAFASGRNVRLVDGPKLFGLIQQARAARDQPSQASRAARAGRAKASVPARPVTAFSATAFAAPLAMTCPSCSSAMVRRVAKRGDNAGKPFWGCTRYPAGCRGTRPWDEPVAQLDA